MNLMAQEPTPPMAAPPAGPLPTWTDEAASKMRIYAIDEQPLCRRGLAAMLSGDPDCLWAGEAASVTEALRLASELRPDVVLIDHQPPVCDAVAAMAALQPMWPGARFVLLSDRADAAEVRRALASGAACVLPNTVGQAELLRSVRAVHAGSRLVPQAMAAALRVRDREAQLRNDLTPREMALLELMAQGLDNRAIAQAMTISVPTVKFHVTNIMAKLHASNRTAAVLAALRMKLVKLQPVAEAQGR